MKNKVNNKIDKIKKRSSIKPTKSEDVEKDKNSLGIIDHSLKKIEPKQRLFQKIFYWVCYMEHYQDMFYMMKFYHLSPFYIISSLNCIHGASKSGKHQLLQFL